MASDVVACPSCKTKNRVPCSSPGTPRCAQCHSDLPWVAEAGDDDFTSVVDSSKLVLVDLWAPWCGPCKAVAPVLETLARDFAGNLKVVKVNVDEAPRTAQRYEARSIPTLLFLRGGELVDRVVGAQPERALRDRIQHLL